MGETVASDVESEVLAAVQRVTAASRHAVVATTGYTSRALYALGDLPNQFYMVGSMGCAASFGFGLARARPACSPSSGDKSAPRLFRDSSSSWRSSAESSSGPSP